MKLIFTNLVYLLQLVNRVSEGIKNTKEFINVQEILLKN